MTDAIDHSAGMILNKKAGDYVTTGEQIAMFYYNDEGHIREAEDIFLSGLEVGAERVEPRGVILEVIQ